MKKVFFDESGQTGTHLVDFAQPFFAIGSTDIEENEAVDIIKSCFPRHQSDELKSKKLFKQPTARRGLIQFAAYLGEHPERFCGVQIGKRFTTVSKLVDNLVEPTMRALGYDFYADNYAAKYANMAYFALTNFLAKPSLDKLLTTYNTFARSPQAATLRELQTELGDLVTTSSEHAVDFLEMMKEGADGFTQFHDLNDFEDTNDVHVTAAVRCMNFWQERHRGPFEVVHDESVHFFSRSERWETMTDPSLPPTLIGVGEKVLRLPIPVASTSSARSHESASLQLCDLVAGFITRASVETRDQNFFREAFEAGLGKLTIYPIDAGTDFVDGPPRLLDGPDAIDQIIGAVRKGSRRR